MYLFLLFPLAVAAEELLAVKLEVPEQVFTNSANIITAKLSGGKEKYAGKYLGLYADQKLLEVKQLGTDAPPDYQFTWRAEGLTKHQIRVVLANDQDLTDIVSEDTQERTAIINGYAGSTSLLPFISGEAAKGDFLFTIGDSRYSGLIKQGDVYSVHFSPELPAGAVVKQARLFVSWTWSCWGDKGVDPQMLLSLDNQSLIPDRRYSDRKGWGKFDYPSGTWTYDVTKLIAEKNNYTVEVKNRNTENLFAVNGIGLLIVYEDSMSDKAPMKYWINEGCDILMARSDSFASEEEATTWTYFAQVPAPEQVAAATLINLVPSGDKGRNMLIFNKGIYQGLWDGKPYSDFSYNIQDVTRAVKEGENAIGFRDRGDYMVPSVAVLMLRLKTGDGSTEKTDQSAGKGENVGELTGSQAAAADVPDQDHNKAADVSEKKASESASESEKRLKEQALQSASLQEEHVKGNVLVKVEGENLSDAKGLYPADSLSSILMSVTMLTALMVGFWTERIKLINCQKLDRRTICLHMARK